MVIIPDACGYGIGAVLTQSKDGQEHPIAYASRLLTQPESNYSITEKECLTLVWSLAKFKSLVWGCQITVVTDHQALCWLMTKKDLAGRLARWSLSLEEYDIRIIYRNGKLHDKADCLSRHPLPQTEDEMEDRCITIAALADEVSEQQAAAEISTHQKLIPEWKKIIEQTHRGKSIKNVIVMKGLLYLQTI